MQENHGFRALALGCENGQAVKNWIKLEINGYKINDRNVLQVEARYTRANNGTHCHTNNWQNRWNVIARVCMTPQMFASYILRNASCITPQSRFDIVTYYVQ